jgi:hypothetical protein
MSNAQDAVEQVWQYLANELSLDEFEDWSASYLTDVFQSGDAQAQEVGRVIRSILNAYGDDSTDAALRSELVNAISPFAKTSAQNSVGKPSMIAESSASSDVNRVLVAA